MTIIPQQPDFEEDRIVVREGEEVPKKGWFSGNKQRAPNGSASTPPSITSVGQTQKPDQQAGGDGDLPPREVKTPEASTPTTDVQKPNDVADGIAQLPPRAGFDLAAMRAAIEDIEESNENQRDASGLAWLEISPPLPPPGTITKNPLSASPMVISSPGLTPISEYPSGKHNPATSYSRDFRSTSTRSPSFDDTRDVQQFGFEDATGDADEDYSLSSSPSPTPPLPHSPLAADSTSSFEGDYKASWTPAVAEKDIFGGFGTSIGNSFHSTPFAAEGSTAMTALPPNRSNASPAVSIADRDPWSFPGYSVDVSASSTVKKLSTSTAANPWES